MKTGPARLTQFVFVYQIQTENGKKFYYDVALPFWNIVQAKIYAKEVPYYAKVLEVFPL